MPNPTDEGLNSSRPMVVRIAPRIVEIMRHRWVVSAETTDEGWRILTEDACMGTGDYGKGREWIATAADWEVANHIVKLHNSAVKIATGE